MEKNDRKLQTAQDNEWMGYLLGLFILLLATVSSVFRRYPSHIGSYVTGHTNCELLSGIPERRPKASGAAALCPGLVTGIVRGALSRVPLQFRVLVNAVDISVSLWHCCGLVTAVAVVDDVPGPI